MTYSKNNKSYTVQEATKVLENYCVYQDRCHLEVVQKLNSLGMIPLAKEEIIIHLITHNFLNEERFAKSFARGKFNIKKYGKNRIVQELKFKQISSYNIQMALKEIDNEAYLNTLDHLALKKWTQTIESNFYKKKKKVIDALLRKGYEYALICNALENLE